MFSLVSIGAVMGHLTVAGAASRSTCPGTPQGCEVAVGPAQQPVPAPSSRPSPSPSAAPGAVGAGPPQRCPPHCLLAALLTASSLPSSLPSSPSSLRGRGRAAPGPLPEGQRSGRPGARHSRSSDAGAEQTCRKLGPCCRHSLAGLEGSMRVGSPGPSKRPVSERPGRAPWLGGAGLLQFANVVQILSL